MDSVECCICLGEITAETPYAVIYSTNEPPNKYHPECIENWISVSNRCVITDESIKSYAIYHIDEIIETHNLVLNDVIEDIDEDIDEDINEDIDEDIEEDNEISCIKVCCFHSIIIGVFAVIMLFGIG